MRLSQLASDFGARPDVQQVGVLITDGESNDRDQTYEEARKLRADGNTLMAVGIGIKVRYNPWSIAFMPANSFVSAQNALFPFQVLQNRLHIQQDF